MSTSHAAPGASGNAHVSALGEVIGVGAPDGEPRHGGGAGVRNWNVWGPRMSPTVVGSK